MTNHTESDKQALSRCIVQALDAAYPLTELPDVYRVVHQAAANHSIWTVEERLRELIGELRQVAKSDNFTEIFVAGAYVNAAQAIEEILEFHAHKVAF